MSTTMNMSVIQPNVDPENSFEQANLMEDMRIAKIVPSTESCRDKGNVGPKFGKSQTEGPKPHTNVVSPDQAKTIIQTSKQAKLRNSGMAASANDDPAYDENQETVEKSNIPSTIQTFDGKAESDEGNVLDDDDSSHDDDSYFADPSHLPEPKSGRRFSWSSNNSAPHPATQLMNAKSKESDASLSLSDDSDVEAHQSHSHGDPCIYDTNPGFSAGNHPGIIHYQTAPAPTVGTQPYMMQKPNTGVPELYPQQLTRMHSLSSLVSNSSKNSSASESSVRDELRDVAAEHFRNQRSEVPSGRRSPVLGEHPPSRNHSNPYASPSTINQGPSPPTIFQTSSVPPGAYLQPQPHMMTPEQLSAWMNAANKPTPRKPVALNPNSIKLATITYSKSGEVAYSGESDSFGANSFNQRESSGQRAPGDNTSSNSNGGLQPSEGGLRPSDDRLSEARVERRDRDFGKDNKMESSRRGDEHFKVYWQRWLMLFYMSILNLLSDWTCYSVAPIALLTEEAFGNINSEQLVTVFLGANAIASACEPMILARLGLRRTVLFGALLLMIGSIIKSGGMPPIIQANLEKGEGEWRVYLGFFIVGLSQPLYQCTPALLSASWFPEVERTMATGVALNANQLGIGFAFIFGTLLVADSDDIPGYFGLLSMISTLAFLGTLIQFADAPPTPPSETAKVVRGTLEVNLPSVATFLQTMRNIGTGGTENNEKAVSNTKTASAPAPSSGDHSNLQSDDGSRRSRGSRGSSRSRKDRRSRRRGNANKSTSISKNDGENGLIAFHGLAHHPSPAWWGRVATREGYQEIGDIETLAPSPMMPGPVDNNQVNREDEDGDQSDGNPVMPQNVPHYPQQPYMMPPGYPYFPPNMPVDEDGVIRPQVPNPYQVYPPYPYPYPYWDPRLQQYASYYQQQAYQQGVNMTPPNMAVQPDDPYNSIYSYQYGLPPPPHMRGYETAQSVLPPGGLYDGAEPVLTITPNHLDIDIRDDQIILSLRACMARPGFIHSLVSFTVSGIVINTLSTYMDYLVRLNGAGREYTGIVGGSFQFCIMISSLLVGKLCDTTRAYYSITIGMLVLGAFGLAECGVSLDADRGNELRYALVIVAILVGPLQPVSTELGVDVAYPLSENTVLVIQQLFSNLLSAAFIPCFKAMKDIGIGFAESGVEKPEYTFSFYLLIVLHAVCTVFFATFNGRYLRYEAEQEKLAKDERRKREEAARAFHPLDHQQEDFSESTPLIPPVV